MNAPNVSEYELHAYVDQQLPAERLAMVERWLAEHPDAAARVAAYRAQKAALRSNFDHLLDDPLPPSLQALSIQPLLPGAGNPNFGRKWKLPGWPALAASVLIAVTAGSAGWLAHARYGAFPAMAQSSPLAHQAAIAHVVYSPDQRRPVEVTGDQEAALVKWLTKRLGSPVRAPALGGLGYELVGGRLLPGQTGPVAQFMYQNAQAQRLTLYVSPEVPDALSPAATPSFRFAQERSINVFYWLDGRFGYALSGEIDKGELARIATLVYDQLQKAVPPVASN